MCVGDWSSDVCSSDLVVGFSIGERASNEDTFIVHIEKAFADIQGAYPMINQQFVIHEMENFKYVNREDDVGEEGLRKSKLSYRPVVVARFRLEYFGYAAAFVLSETENLLPFLVIENASGVVGRLVARGEFGQAVEST